MASTEIYTLSLHDALPISFRSEREFFISSSERHVFPERRLGSHHGHGRWRRPYALLLPAQRIEIQFISAGARSEEHTSELQSQSNLVCRLLLEKKNKIYIY